MSPTHRGPSSPFSAHALRAAAVLAACLTLLGLSPAAASAEPALPVITAFPDPGPRNRPGTGINGTATGAALVRAYASRNCTGEVLETDTTIVGGRFGLLFNVPKNATTTLSVDASDTFGSRSGCVVAGTVVHDDRPPADPVFVGFSERVPSSERFVQTNGLAESGADVRLGFTAACDRDVVKASGGGFWLTTVSFPTNATTTLYGRATDAAGNASACVRLAEYTHDDIPPSGVPNAGARDPETLGRKQTWSIGGRGPALATAGLIVGMFGNGTCSGRPQRTATIDGNGRWSSYIVVAQNATTGLSVTYVDEAGNVSPNCVDLGTYTNDSIAPGVSVIGPPAPGPRTTRSTTIGAETEASATVEVWTGATCGGTRLVATGANNTGFWKATFDVPANAATTLSLRAVDKAGNVGGCVVAGTVTHDDVAPAAPVWAAPPSPSSNQSVRLRATTPERTGTARIYRRAGCLGGSLTLSPADLDDPGQLVTAPPNTTSEWSVRLTDAAGNVSPCSSTLAFTHDDVAPAAPTGRFSTRSPSSVASGQVFGAAEAGATVTTGFAADCTAGVAVTALAGNTWERDVTFPANAITTVYGRVTDAAGNASPCVALLTYTHDDLPPAPPEIDDLEATRIGSTLFREFDGHGEPGGRVVFYEGADCSGGGLNQGTHATGDFTVGIPLPANGTLAVSALDIDVAGNRSDCVDLGVFTHDDLAPAAPVLAGTEPAATPSPAELRPRVLGTAEDDALVELFATADCTGTPLVAGTAAQLAAPGLTIDVVADATTVVRARATDLAGNVSPCSEPLAYTHATLPAPEPQRPQAEVVVPPAPTPPTPPAAEPPAAPAPLTLSVTATPRCLAATSKTRRSLKVRYGLSATAKLAFKLQRKRGKAELRTRCPKPSSKVTAGNADFADALTGEVRAAAAAAKAKARRAVAQAAAATGTVALPKALKPGRYRLVVSATAADGRTAQATTYLWVLAPAPKQKG